MFSPFMTTNHCAKFATRRALCTGNVFHVIATWIAEAPYTVIDDNRLYELGDRIEIADLLFTADPFADAIAS